MNAMTPEELSIEIAFFIRDNDHMLISSRSINQIEAVMRRVTLTGPTLPWVPIDAKPLPHYGDMVVMLEDETWCTAQYNQEQGWWEWDGVPLNEQVVAWLDIIPCRFAHPERKP